MIANNGRLAVPNVACFGISSLQTASESCTASRRQQAADPVGISVLRGLSPSQKQQFLIGGDCPRREKQKVGEGEGTVPVEKGEGTVPVEYRGDCPCGVVRG